MKNKTKLYLALVVLAIFLLPLTKMMEKREKKVNLINIKQENINKISILNKGELVELTLEDGVWFTNNPVHYKADTLKVTNVFKNFIRGEIPTTSLSQKEENHKKYNVTDSLGVLVTVSDGENSEAYYIGKSKNYMTCYIRPAEEKTVYLFPKNLTSSTFISNPSAWRDRNVLSVDMNQLRNIHLKSEKYDYMVNVDGENWTILEAGNNYEGMSTSQAAVKLKNRLKNIATSQFIDNEYETYAKEFESPQWFIDMETITGRKHTIEAIEKDGKVIAKIDQGTTHLYILTKSFITQMIPDPKTLKKGK
jgi:hypothetical protein